MKAEQRKELQTNSLARFLGNVGGNIKGGLSGRGRTVLVVAVLLVLAWGGWRIVSGLTAKRNSERWVKLDLAAPEDLSTFAKENADTVQANVAKLLIARRDLTQGMRDVYTQRKEAAEKLTAAAETFEALVKEFKSSPILVQECLLGAAAARETLGEFDAAQKHYEELATKHRDSRLAGPAADRAKALKERRAEFVALDAELKKLRDRAVLPPLPPIDDKKDEKKADEKKTEEKKAEEKKTEDKKDAEKKSPEPKDDKKTEEKKPAEKETAEKKDEKKEPEKK